MTESSSCKHERLTWERYPTMSPATKVQVLPEGTPLWGQQAVYDDSYRLSLPWCVECGKVMT